MNTNSKNVDLINSTVGGCLKQIRKSNDIRCLDEPDCVEAWTCLINPLFIKEFIKFIEQNVKSQDPIEFKNIKRFRKANDQESKLVEAIFCSKTYQQSKQELLSFLQSFPDGGTPLVENKISLRLIPILIPKTKEIALKWSNEFWPISWKGNPDHQDLLSANFELTKEEDAIKRLRNLSSTSCNNHATIIAKENKNEEFHTILCLSVDMTATHPLKHSIIVAIDEIALQEKSREVSKESQRNYLCQDLLVYTTHEPCAMCAMALVHSRIKRLVYINPEKGGAIESSLYIGDRRDLNWTFDIWRWIGDY